MCHKCVSMFMHVCNCEGVWGEGSGVITATTSGPPKKTLKKNSAFYSLQKSEIKLKL